MKIEHLYAPLRYEWKLIRQRDRLVFNLVNKKSQVKSKIKYVWNISVDMDEEIILYDETIELYSSIPGRRLWSPHYKKRQSLESVFIKILKDIGLNFTTIPWVKITDNGHCISSIEDYLSQARLQSSTFTLEHFIAAINKRVESDREDILDNIIKFIPLNMLIPENVFNYFDFIKPIKTKQKLHAFNLMSVEMLQKYGVKFFDVLIELSKQDNFNPIKWYSESTYYPIDLKLAIISLITHNHYAEEYFVAALALKYNVDIAWQGMIAINQLYIKERIFWTDLSSPQIQQIGQVKAKEYLYKIPRQYKIQNWQEGQSYIPYSQMYHYYGAFIIAKGLSLKFNQYNYFIPSFVAFLGGKYKDITDTGLKSKINQLVYKQGALDALSIKENDNFLF